MATSRKPANKDASDTGAELATQNVFGALMLPATAFPDDMMRGITSFEDAARIAVEAYGDVVDAAEEMGNGFKVVADKNELIGVPFIVLHTRVNEYGDHGAFVSLMAVTQDNRKVIFNDGSTGVFTQIVEMTKATGRNGGYLFKNGLRKSEYAMCGADKCFTARPTRQETCPNPACTDPTTHLRGQATTFYLDV